MLTAVTPSPESGKGKDVLMRDVLAVLSEKIEKASRVGGRFADKPAIESSIRTSLGETSYWLGQYAVAERHLERALLLDRRHLGEEHLVTLWSMHRLAGLYVKQGRHDEAEPLDVKALELAKRIMGQEHTNTLASMGSLANVYRSQGRYDEAERLYVKELELSQRVYGEQYPGKAHCLRGLALVLDRLDRSADALSLWRELQEFQLARGEDPKASAKVLNRAAWDLLTNEHAELHDPARALRFAERACAKGEAIARGALWMYLDTLALTQHLTGDTPAAIETEKKALSLVPPETPMRGELEAALAKFGAALDQADTAEHSGGG